jgi:hypothetical protein
MTQNYVETTGGERSTSAEAEQVVGSSSGCVFASPETNRSIIGTSSNCAERTLTDSHVGVTSVCSSGTKEAQSFITESGVVQTSGDASTGHETNKGLTAAGGTHTGTTTHEGIGTSANQGTTSNLTKQNVEATSS